MQPKPYIIFHMLFGNESSLEYKFTFEPMNLNKIHHPQALLSTFQALYRSVSNCIKFLETILTATSTDHCTAVVISGLSTLCTNSCTRLNCRTISNLIFTLSTLLRGWHLFFSLFLLNFQRMNKLASKIFHQITESDEISSHWNNTYFMQNFNLKYINTTHCGERSNLNEKWCSTTFK